MAGDGEARWREPGKIAGATVHFVQFPTVSAVKVVVMPLMRRLVMDHPAGDFDHADLARGLPVAQRPVDGGDAQAGLADLGRSEDLGRRQGTLG